MENGKKLPDSSIIISLMTNGEDKYNYSSISRNSYIKRSNNKKNIDLLREYVKSDFEIFYCETFEKPILKTTLRDDYNFNFRFISYNPYTEIDIKKDFCDEKKRKILGKLECVKKNGVTDSLFSRENHKDDNIFNQYYVIRKIMRDISEIKSREPEFIGNRPFFPEREQKRYGRNRSLSLKTFIPETIVTLKSLMKTRGTNIKVSEEILRLELMDSSFFEILDVDREFKFFMKCEFSKDGINRTMVRIPYIIKISNIIFQNMENQLQNINSPIGQFLGFIESITKEFPKQLIGQVAELKTKYLSSEPIETFGILEIPYDKGFYEFLKRKFGEELPDLKFTKWDLIGFRSEKLREEEENEKIRRNANLKSHLNKINVGEAYFENNNNKVKLWTKKGPIIINKNKLFPISGENNSSKIERIGLVNKEPIFIDTAETIEKIKEFNSRHPFTRKNLFDSDIKYYKLKKV